MRGLRRGLGAATLVALAAIAGCSAIGDPGGMPDGLPHGGTGQFRFLDATETGITGPLPGRAMVLRDRAIESAMAAGGSLFYAQATLMEEPPMVPEDHPAGEVYGPAFGPRAIHRGAPRETGVGAFDAGPQVLAATEAWEGADVFDPWALVDDDGTVRLYYAAAGGIGVAEASAVEGPFSKAPGPILDEGDAVSGAPRRPSVVRGIDGAYWMYFDAGGAIRVAVSSDGRAFTVMGDVSLEGDDETESPEVRVANPGAVAIETTADRTLIRLYFESIREDGAHRVYVAGSADGVTFERHPREVMENADIRFPAPDVVDTRVTLLYLNLPFFGGLLQTRGVSVAVAPAGQRFDEPTE